MAEFPPKNQRDQLLALVTFLAVAAMGAFYVYVWDAKHTTLNETEARVEKLVATNDSVKREMAKVPLQKLQAESEQLGRNLEIMRQLVPTSNEVPVLLDQVSDAARRAGLELADVQPEPMIRGQQFDAYRYKMAVIGDFHQVGAFLANVGSLTRVITPMNLELAPVGVGAARRQWPGQQYLGARFQIQTYVAKTRTAAPVTGGAQ